MIISRAQRNITIFSKINKCSPYTSNLVMSKITIVSGHMIRTFKFKSNFLFHIWGVLGVSYVEPRVAKISGA